MGIVEVHHLLSMTIHSSAFLLNLLLLFLILNHSRFEIRQFKWVFLMTCVGDLFLSTVCLFSQPIIFFIDGYMTMTSNGPFCCRSELLDHIAMTAFCAGLHAQIVIVVLQYVWRYSLLLKDLSLIEVTKPKLVVPFLWCAMQAVTAAYCWNFDQTGLRDRELETFREEGWEYTNDTAPFPAMTSMGAFKTTVHNVFYMTSPIVGYIIIVACHLGVSNFLNRHGAPSHSITKRANDEVKRALIALAITPLVSLSATATIVGSEWLQIPIGLRVSGFLSLGMTLLAFTNPVMTMIFVAPYRNALLNMFGVRKSRIVARGPTTFPESGTDAILG